MNDMIRTLVTLAILIAVLSGSALAVVLGAMHANSHPFAAALAIFGGGLMALFTAEALIDFIEAVHDDHRRNRGKRP